ncbi:hypothetical protein MB46_07305 [Arthrobacter alpinus]|nr:hypothetical protein MB46_07305 [Arthrobacter alpinus]
MLCIEAMQGLQVIDVDFKGERNDFFFTMGQYSPVDWWKSRTMPELRRVDAGSQRTARGEG